MIKMLSIGYINITERVSRFDVFSYMKKHSCVIDIFNSVPPPQQVISFNLQKTLIYFYCYASYCCTEKFCLIFSSKNL